MKKLGKIILKNNDPKNYDFKPDISRLEEKLNEIVDKLNELVDFANKP